MTKEFAILNSTTAFLLFYCKNLHLSIVILYRNYANNFLMTGFKIAHKNKTLEIK